MPTGRLARYTTRIGQTKCHSVTSWNGLKELDREQNKAVIEFAAPFLATRH
jgi:hypothetical protein